jgi:hypothetical protein
MGTALLIAGSVLVGFVLACCVFWAGVAHLRNANREDAEMTGRIAADGWQANSQTVAKRLDKVEKVLDVDVLDRFDRIEEVIREWQP